MLPLFQKQKKDVKFNPNDYTGPLSKQTWIICTDEISDKKRLMSYLISMKLKRQEDLDDVLEEVKDKSVGDLMNPKNQSATIERYKGRDASEDDGYWILLQDWSECSLKCGSGKTTQQWMCVPPRRKGKPCVGQAIRTKVCNKQACPSVIGDNEIPTTKDDKNHITMKPIYKAMPFSKRPQQFVKCLIKENDILYKTLQYDPQKKKAVKVPGRIVMNTKTISVFESESFERSLFSFNLVDTVFSRSGSDHCCFFLTSRNRQHEVCGFNSNCGTIKDPVWVKKWGYDFEYFQKKCYTPLGTGDEKDKIDLDKRVGNAGIGSKSPSIPLTEAQKAVVEGRRRVVQNKIDEDTEAQNDKKSR